MATQNGKQAKVSIESLSDEQAIFKAVRNKCFQAPFTILPLAAAAGMLLLTASFSLGFLGVFASLVLAIMGAASFVYHLWIRGEAITREHLQWLMAQLKADRHQALTEVAEMCEKIGFAEGAKEARELSEAYSQYTTFLESKAGTKLGAAVGERLSLAESARRAGVGHLRQAAEIHIALAGIDFEKLRSEHAAWTLEKQQPTANLPILTSKLAAHSRQIERYQQLVFKRDEFIALVNELEAALKTAYMAEAGRSDLSLDNNSDNPAKRLSNVVDAAEAAEKEMVNFLDDIQRNESITNN